ncbi:MAG: queuosine precursor transporter [Acidobacteriota bacterium]|nr:MAG: queuosine precursor transporter [Acidobacteriota bacterium]
MTLPYEYINDALHERRERVFLVLTSLFIGSLAMLNILGISRFVDLSFSVGSLTIPFSVAVGVLPYPLTFLCTDFISELYGRKRANYVVLMGFMVNLWIVLILWVGGSLPGFEPVDPGSGEIIRDAAGRLPVFFELRALTFGAVAASMIAYLSAQFCDVYMFHFWKNLTGGRHLWLRNNGSTLVSQLVDTVSVILITHFYAKALPVDPERDLWPQLLFFVASGYIFKVVAALLDTVPFYWGVRWFSAYLQLDPAKEHGEELAGEPSE